MKSFLLFALALCGRFALAVDPVAVWNANFATISVSKINAEIDETYDKAEVTLAPGAVVDYDAALKVPTKFVSAGSITLSHATQPNLAKADFSGVTGGVKRDWIKAGIGFNFASKRGPVVSGALEGGSDWYDNNDGGSDDEGKNGTDVGMSADGLTKISWTSKNTYDDTSSHGVSTTASMVRGYLDDGNGVAITVKNVPFAEYAVIIYASTDNGNALSYKTVNGVDYTAKGDSDVAVVGTSSWGVHQSSAGDIAYGRNAIRVVAQKETTLTINSRRRDAGNLKIRGCISAIQIVPYTTRIAPSLVEGKSVGVAVETGAETYAGGRVTLTIPAGALDLGTYTEDQISYKIVFAGKIDAVAGEKQKDGAVTFVLPDTEYVAGNVYRGQVVLDYGDGVTPLGSVTVYEGEQQFVWTPEGALWVNETPTTMGSTGVWTDGITVAGEKLVVNTASGVTFTPTANPDYIEKCDSTFMVSISASEAVDAASDPEPAADVQGGVRIASVGGVLKVQALADGKWTDLKTSGVEVNRDYEVVVAFHYAKEGVEDDADSVSYTLDGVTVTGGKVANTGAKISSVEVADGTSLAFLKGICQLDKAVIVDVEIDPGAEKPIEAKDLDAAQAVADKIVVAISDEVAKVVDATTYRGYFKVVAKKGEDGKFHAVVEFAPGTRTEIEDDIKKAMEKFVSGIATGSAEIAAKPGLYYGVKRGDALNDMAVRDPLTLAGADGKVTITITKPEKSNGHFYRLICAPTP